MAYHSNSVWEEEHAGYHTGSGDAHEDYHSGTGDVSSGYNSGSGEPDMGYKTGAGEKEEKEKEMSEFEHQVEKENKQTKEEDEEETIFKTAAQEIHQQMDQEQDIPKKKKTHSNIDKAIEDAIKEEQEVLHLNR